MKVAIFIAVVALATPLWAFSETFNKQPLSFQSYTVGGAFAKAHEYPYMVGLKVSHSSIDEEFYTGALLPNNWVITAAHCVQGAKRIVGVLGAYNIIERETSVQHVPVVQTIIHPEWDPENNTSDLALLKLSDDLIPVRGIIAPVKLPEYSLKERSLWGWPAVVTGWGRGKNGVPAPILQKIETQIEPNMYCELSYSTRTISDSHICTAGYQKNVLNIADSGAPMVIEGNGMRALVGVASYNADWGTQSYPAVFTRVTSFLEWIHETTGIPTA